MPDRITDDDGELVPVLSMDEPTDAEMLAAFRMTLEFLLAEDARILDAAKAQDLDAATAFFDQLDAQVTRLRDLHRELALALGDRLDDEGLPQVGRVTRAWSGASYRNWNPDLVRHVKTKLRAEATIDANGERVMDPDDFQIVWDVLGSLFTLTPPNMKVSYLRHLGFEPDEYAESTPGHAYAKVVR